MTRDELLVRLDAYGDGDIVSPRVLIAEAGFALVPLAFPKITCDQSELVAVPKEFLMSKRGPIDQQIREQERKRCADVVRGGKYDLPEFFVGKTPQQFNRTLDAIAETIEKGEHGEG